MKMVKEFTKGIWTKNPILVIGIGLCPVLAVTSSVTNALWMTVATTFVLVCSNLLVSSVKSIVPAHIRIPVFISIIATFVTVVELVLKAYQPEVYKSLGIFIPLIVVNCIILGRAEEFASKNTILLSIADGLGMGLGFGATLVVLSFFRETLGANSLLGYTFIPGMKPATALIMAPGGFIILGLMLWGMNKINNRKK
ncbi:MAG: electron transport complex subunit E [Spirochaetes bacterium]|nr:electron transport complex subunit E [Spirochaetota bacterium]